MRKSLVLAVAALSTAGLGALIPTAANAASSGSTNATFTLSGGAISIAVPDSSGGAISVASGSTGAASVSGQLGNTVVTDQRGALVATWTANAASTNFTTGAGSANETVTKANVSYSAGLGTAPLGQVGAFVATVGGPVALAGSGGAVGSWSGTGNNTVTWNPTLTFTLSPSQVVGTYSGSITQSVS